MKRDNVTFDLPHDEHIRDFHVFVADKVAKRLAKHAYARRRAYAKRPIVAAMV
jgi:hypothetical protein